MRKEKRKKKKKEKKMKEKKEKKFTRPVQFKIDFQLRSNENLLFITYSVIKPYFPHIQLGFPLLCQYTQ
jgi:hypothetical protein